VDVAPNDLTNPVESKSKLDFFDEECVDFEYVIKWTQQNSKNTFLCLEARQAKLVLL